MTELIRFAVDLVDRFDTVDTFDKVDKVGRVNRVDKVDSVDRVDRVDRVDKVDNVELSLAKPQGGKASRESALPTSLLACPSGGWPLSLFEVCIVGNV